MKVILLSGGKSNRNTISTTAEVHVISMKWWEKNILNIRSRILSPIHNLI